MLPHKLRPFRVKPSPASLPYASAIAAGGGGGGVTLLTDLFAFYRANGTDRSGNARNLSATGSPTTGTGLGGAANAALAWSMGLGGNYWSLSGITLNPPYSISVFITQSAGASGSAGFSGLSQASASNDVFAFVEPNGLGEFLPGLGVAGADFFFISTSEDTFVHACVVVDAAGEANIYFDGSAEDSASIIGTKTIDQILFGFTDAVGSSGKAQFLGIWSRDLAPSEIAQLYNAGAGHDPTA